MGSSKWGKLAPTWLYKDGKTALFSTQLEVDAAWDNGWTDDQGGEPKKSVNDLTAKEMIASIESAETLEGLQIYKDMEMSTPTPRKTVLGAVEKREKDLNEDLTFED